MAIGQVTSAALQPVATTAGTIYAPEREMNQLTWQDLLALCERAGRKRDGLFTVTATHGAGGATLTVTTNAGATTIGPFPFQAEQVTMMLDYLAREGRMVDGLA